MDRNLLQGQHLLNEGLSTREYLSEAYRSLAQHPGQDLCAVLALKGWLDPLQAERARQHVAFLMLSGSGIVPIVDEDLSKTLSGSGISAIDNEDLSKTVSVNQAFSPSSSDLLPTINENISSDFQPTISGVLPAVSEIRSAIVGEQSLDKTVIPGSTAGGTTSPPLHNTTFDSHIASTSPGQGLKRIGDYEILSEISHGGVGAVYVAQNLKLRNKVALKTLLAGKLASAESISRFKLEAETAARLSHPNMVKVLDVGEFEGNHFLVMELIEGSSLKEVITEAPLEPGEAARLTETIARALAYAHRRAVLHRDIKPANILIRDSDGCPLITDFGLAKDFGSEAERNGLTVTGQFIGTPEYMSPEQANGELQLVDRRADIYSLGASLYEMITGRVPFQSPTLPNLVHAIMTQDAEAPSEYCEEVSPDLDTIILKSLEKDPVARYLTMEDFADDLHRYLTDQAILARRPGLTERFRRWRRRHKVALQLILATSLTAFAILASTVLYPRWQQRRDRLREQQQTAQKDALIKEAQTLLAMQLNELVEDAEAKLQSTNSVDAAIELYLFENKKAASKEETARWKKKLNGSQDFLNSLKRSIPKAANAGPNLQLKAFISKDDRARAIQKAFNQLKIAHWQAQIYYLSGLIQHAAGQIKQASKTWASAYSLSPNSRGGSLAYLALADEFLDRKNFSKAKTIYSEVLGHKDPTVKGRARLGWTLIQIADARFDLAKAHLESIDLKRLPPRFRELARLSLDVSQKFAGKEELPAPVSDFKSVLLSNGKTILFAKPDGQSYHRYEFEFNNGAIELLRRDDSITLPKVQEVPEGKYKRFHAYLFWPTKNGRIQLIGFETSSHNIFGMLYFHSWNGKQFVENNYPPMDARSLERRYGFTFTEMCPTSVGDIDGNGLPELFLTKRWNPAKGQILWNITGPGNKLTTLPTDSQIGGQRFLDFDGDGKDELIVSFTGWKLYGVNIYKGQAPENFDTSKPRFELLGSCGVPIIHQPDRKKTPELLVTASRSQEQDIVSIYGEDLAPEKSDGLYSIRWTKAGYAFKPLFMLPFEKRREQTILLTVSLATMFPQYPDSFLVRSRENRFGKNDFMTISSGNRRASVVIKPKYSGRKPFTIDIDKDGDLELVWMRGNPSTGSEFFVVWGLKDKVKSVQIKQVEEIRNSRREQSVELIALDLLRAGQAEETLRFVANALLDMDPKSNERIRLLFVKAHALASLGQLFDARALCQSIFEENERWGIKALKQAALYSEQMQDYKSAVTDLRKLQAAFVLDRQLTLEVKRLLSRLTPLANLKPVLKLDTGLIRDPKLPCEIFNPWYFELDGPQFHANLKNMSKASLKVPIGKFSGDSVRIQTSFRLKAFDLSRNAHISIYNAEDRSSNLTLSFGCNGGGDERSFQRRAVITFANRFAISTFINEMGDFHFDPDAVIDLDVIYSQQTGLLQFQAKSGEAIWKDYLFVPSARLSPGPYRMEINHVAYSGNDQYVGAYLKLAFQSITLSLPEGSLQTEENSTTTQLGLAGRDWVIKDYRSADQRLNRALTNIAAAIRDPKQAEKLKTLQEDEFLASFLKACVLIQLEQDNAAVQLLGQIRKNYPRRFDQYWPLHFASFPARVQSVLASFVTNGMTLQQISTIGAKALQARSQGSLLYFYQIRQDQRFFSSLFSARVLCGDFESALKELAPYLNSPQNREIAGQLCFKLRKYKSAYLYWKPLEAKLGKRVDYLIAKKFALRK